MGGGGGEVCLVGSEGGEKMVGPNSFLSGAKNQSPQIGEKTRKKMGSQRFGRNCPAHSNLFLLTLICLFPPCFFIFSDLVILFSFSFLMCSSFAVFVFYDIIIFFFFPFFWSSFLFSTVFFFVERVVELLVLFVFFGCMMCSFIHNFLIKI